MNSALAALLIFAGGALGSLARWGLGELHTVVRSRLNAHDPAQAAVPWHTVIANALACFILGVVVMHFGAERGPSTWVYVLAATGFCGGLSTLSTAAWEIADLVRKGHPVTGTGYTLFTIGLCMAALWVGVMIAA